MKMSKLGISTSKERISSDEILSERILTQSGMLKRYSTGIYGMHHFLVRMQFNVEAIIRETLDRYDCIEVSLPILQPKSMWESSGRWEKYASSGQLFFCDTESGSFCVAPTAEEAMFEFARDSLKSYKSLPVTLYQIGPKFRNELRSRGGLLRTKQFSMMDAYSFHATSGDLNIGYARMKNAYFEIFNTLGLKVIPVSASNGDMGGKTSEEFMLVSEVGEDTILVNQKKGVAFNVEVIQEQLANYEQEGFEKKKAIELGHIFQLGQKYSNAMKGYFKSTTNEDVPYFMGCYGIGVSRTLATICEQYCDEEGLALPTNVAPYDFMIVYTESRKDRAFRTYDSLKANGHNVIIDDRDDLRLGAKIKDWKLFGIPYLLIVGDKTENDRFEIERRTDGKKHLINVSMLNYLANDLEGLRKYVDF